MNLILLGFLASLAAGLATGVGALPVLFTKKISDKLMDGMLGFAAGVMLSATAFSLIVPAIEIGGVWITVFGFLFGVLFLDFIDRLIPHMHFISGLEGPFSSFRRVMLLILAITIHNFPEGVSVGVSFGTGDVNIGIVIALAIGLQNMPEGLAVALSLMREKYSRRKALMLATLTGFVEPVGGFLGVSVVTIFYSLLPLGLSFAAGAMMFVVSDEMIPESHRKGHERIATFGVIVGFSIMIVLDNLFG
ncbi:MAG: ZIP family metal transporter [Candidatus Methanofastidiosia archaeon]